MKPEEKAKELVDKYKGMAWGSTMFTRKERQKKCALICVDEMIDQLEIIKEFVDDGSLYRIGNQIHYNEKVKEQINLL